MSDHLPPKPWMTEPKVSVVIAALRAAGGEARFVGGCVRDALLRFPVNDIDLATTLTPDAVVAALAKAKIRAVPTGLDHGVVTAIVDGVPFEVASLRRDVETDGRRAVVAFTTDWAEDAQRRDFRLNALYADPDGTLHDPTGGGLADARAGRVVFVGDAETRIREDTLRILRFFRFQAWFGRGEPDAEALAACARLKDSLATLPAERISKEFLKLLAAEDPRAVIRLMAAIGVLGLILPKTQGLEVFDRLVGIQTEQLFEEDAGIRLAALLPPDPAAAKALARTLRLSNDLRDRLVAALGDGPVITSYLSPREARRAIYQLGHAAFRDRVKLGWARAERTATTPQWRALLALADSWSAPPFPISGEEVVQAGVPVGPMVGRVLKEVEAWWIDHDFIDDKFSAIERLKAVAQGLAY
ncbi:MAG: CCA tRNA nucleotidyltransferase [Caulobacteraceae bacterium]